MDWNRAASRLLASVKSRAFLAVIESLGALAGCLLASGAVGVVMILLFVSPTYKAELELVPRAGEPATPTEIVESVERTGLVDGVETIEDESGLRLRLSGLPSPEVPHELLVLVLSESGFGVDDLSVRPELGQIRIIKEIGIPYLTLQALVFILAGGLLIRFRLDHGPVRAVSRPLASAGLGILAGVGAFLASLVLAQALKLLGLQVQEQEWVLDLLRDRQGLMRLVPWLVLIVPLSEEVFFRGYMFRWLSERSGDLAGYVISSFAFAVVHLNPEGIPVYFTVGLILAWVCRRTGGLMAPVVGHFVYNSIVLAVALQAPLQI
jgi:membrane protease YdiL (CAAX protease family)